MLMLGSSPFPFSCVSWLNLLSFFLSFSAFAQPNPTLVPTDVYSFGVTSAQARISHDFILSNNAATPLALTKVRPSCDCLHIVAWPRVIPPATNGTIAVRLVPDKTGSVDYKVFVESQDPNAPVRVYSLQGTLTPPLARSAPNPNSPVIDSTLLTRAITLRDETCYLSTETVRARLGAGEDLRLIDVRSVQAFSEVHIPSSLNVAGFALKTQRQLQSSTLVLVDAVGGDPALEQTCRDLRKAGFTAMWILKGGLNAWHRAGGPLEGSLAAIDKLAVLTPAEFLHMRDFSDTRVLYVGAPTNIDHAAFLIPEIIYSGGRSSRDANPSSVSTPVILVTDRGEPGERSVAKSLGLDDVETLFLAGGLAGYEEFLRQASAKPERHVMKSGSVGNGGVRGVVRRKPCGGCSG